MGAMLSRVCVLNHARRPVALGDWATPDKPAAGFSTNGAGSWQTEGITMTNQGVWETNPGISVEAGEVSNADAPPAQPATATTEGKVHITRAD